MDWLSNVSPVWREYFLGAAGDATGGLVAQFVSGLLHTARRQVRERFHLPEQTHALQNAIAGAFDTALGAWEINDDESTHYRDLFRDWLLNPAVLNEFCTLLAPDDKSALNLDLLREKFEDTGLSATTSVPYPSTSWSRIWSVLSTLPLPKSRHCKHRCR